MSEIKRWWAYRSEVHEAKPIGMDIMEFVRASDYDAAVKALTQERDAIAANLTRTQDALDDQRKYNIELKAERNALARKIEKVREAFRFRLNPKSDLFRVDQIQDKLERALADEEPHRQPSEMGRSWFCPCCKCHDWVSAQPQHGYGRCVERRKSGICSTCKGAGVVEYFETGHLLPWVHTVHAPCPTCTNKRRQG